MTLVTLTVVGDTISKSGRTISVKIEKTDDQVIDDYLKLPIVLTKTFDFNTPLKEIRQEFKLDIKSLVDSARQNIAQNNLVNKVLEIDV